MLTGNLVKINGDMQFTKKLQEYAINDKWVEEYSSWWELVSASTEGIGQIFYEHTANYVQNIRDIDTCGLHELYSIAKELNVEQIFSYDLEYPPELVDLMNTLSINRSFLLTTGYVLDNDQLKTIYSDIGIMVSAGLSGELSANIIYDADYITGFMEPLICANLTLNSNYSLTSEKSGVALSYQGFMDDIYYDPASTYDSTTSGEIITSTTHTLRNIAIRASYQRETLKTIAQKHAMIGTTKAIEKLIEEYLLRSFTKKDTWRLYTEPSGSMKPTSINDAYLFEQNLPTITDVNSYFNVNVIEYYDNTEYLNVSALAPYNMIITGYSTGYNVTSEIDISGNLITGLVPIDIPDYGPSGLSITGGNIRYWEGENLADSILLSEHTSAEVSAFYAQAGLTGQLADYWNIQTSLWDTFAISGLNRLAVISELTGTRTDAYSATPPSAVPTSGWVVLPTSLSDMHWKYMGTTTGQIPPANIKATLYPTMAPQPFIWNLVEKVYEEFPDIIKTLLRTEQTDMAMLSSQIDPNGNLIDSWKYFNHEWIGYQTFYEESNNLDYNDQMNKDIDRDGPFHVDALSAYILGNTMDSYYSQIGKDYELSASTPNIVSQLTAFYDDILELSGKVIYQYAYDQFDNHYMLYKDDEDLNTSGRMWVRYRNHPLPFPVCAGDSSNYMKQQMYVRGNSIFDMGYIMENHTYDFGFYDNVGWILGRDQSGKDRIIIYVPDYKYFGSPINETLYTVIVDNSINIIPKTIDIQSINNFIGHYSYEEYIIFVYLVQWVNDTTAQFKFKHYNKYTHEFENSAMENVVIYNLPAPQYRPSVYANVWKLAVSESLVTIAYEAVNTHTGTFDGDYVNTIVTIDLKKDTLSNASVDVAIMEHYLVLETP